MLAHIWWGFENVIVISTCRSSHLHSQPGPRTPGRSKTTLIRMRIVPLYLLLQDRVPSEGGCHRFRGGCRFHNGWTVWSWAGRRGADSNQYLRDGTSAPVYHQWPFQAITRRERLHRIEDRNSLSGSRHCCKVRENCWSDYRPSIEWVKREPNNENILSCWTNRNLSLESTFTQIGIHIQVIWSIIDFYAYTYVAADFHLSSRREGLERLWSTLYVVRRSIRNW